MRSQSLRTRQLVLVLVLKAKGDEVPTSDLSIGLKLLQKADGKPR
ncbi:hypothetical protein [Streptomyces sp. NBC_01618]|nr:hypothetical protein OH735_31255 [Streptomyces sp. NBC_01618]